MQYLVLPPMYWPPITVVAAFWCVDAVLFLDTIRYQKQSFQNRARIRTPQGWQWLIAPVRSGRSARPRSIAEIELDLSHRWFDKHWKALEFFYRRAPYFEFYEEGFAPLYRRSVPQRLIELLRPTLEWLWAALRVPARMRWASEESDWEGVTDPSSWWTVPEAALPPRYAGRCRVLSLKPPVYPQAFAGFEANLSVLDLLFNLGPRAIETLRRVAEGADPRARGGASGQ
jgi:hypothetical protein